MYLLGKVAKLLIDSHMIFQGDRTEKVGVIDSEYVVHQGIPSLGGPSLSSKVLLVANYIFFRNLEESSRN